MEIDAEFSKSEFFSDSHTTIKLIDKIMTAKKEKIITISEIGFIQYELKNYDKVIDLFSKTFHTYEAGLSYKEKTDILDKLSFSYEKKGNFQRAIKILQKAIGLSEKENNRSDICYFSSNSGMINLKLYNYKKAIQQCKTAFKISDELQNKRSMAVSLNQIGNIYVRLGNYEKALEHYLDSYRIREKIDNKKTVPNSLNNIGMVYYKLQNFKKAMEFLRKAHQMQVEVNDQKGIGTSLNNLGIIYDETKNYKKALECHSKALQIREEIGGNGGISVSLNNIGNVYLHQKKFEKALVYYQKSLKNKDLKNDKIGIAATSLNIGNIYNELKKYDKALSYLKKCKQLARETKSRELLRDSELVFSEYYTEIGEYKKALDCYKSFSDLKNEIEKDNNSKKITELQLNFEIEQKEKENEIEKLKQIADKYSLISKELEQRIETNFIGESKAIRNISKETLNAAKYKDTNVLITGESGTGKEIISRIIHFASERKNHGFFPVNCAAIPETLLESEFFGHKKGTFTGAVEDKKGLFELAHKGTLFLDEIADMPLALQAKLLRAIEEKKIKKIGYEEEIAVDVRIIATTNQDINQLVHKKEFRLDLYHRLNTVIIDIPPLRERPEDIEPLVKHFIEIFVQKINKMNPRIDRQLFDFLRNYDFPGNVRELKNLVERAMIICDNNILDEKCFPLINSPAGFERITSFNIKQNEEKLIKAALLETNYNQSRAATILGISRHTLIRRIAELNIEIKKT